MTSYNPPIIVTMALDQPSHEYFTSLRATYFPAYCNYLQAHLTLFHHLPADTPSLNDILHQFSDRAIIEMEVTGINNIGKGVAFTVASNELFLMHKTLQQILGNNLIPQDKQKLWPHITIQNKVTAFKARQTMEILLKDFKPFSIKGTGLSTWFYLNGPWQHRQDYWFNGK